MENKIKNEYFLEFIYLIRKNFPKKNLYYFTYFFIKFIGLILSTNNLRNFESKSNNITSFYSILSKICIFNSSIKIINFHYQLISLLIFILCFGIVFYYLFLFFQLKNVFNESNSISQQTNKLLNITKYIEIQMKIITKIVLFINLISGIICEYLSFGIISPIIKHIITDSSKIQNMNIQYISNYFSNILFSTKITMILNIISFIILYFIGYIFMILNDIHCLFSTYGVALYSKKKQTFFIYIFTFFQPIYGYIFIFNDSLRCKIHLFICIFVIIIITFFIISNIYNYNFFYDSKIPIFNLGISIYCWYNGILEIILYNFIKNKEKMTQTFSIIKLFISICTSILILYIILYKNKYYFSILFSKHLFNLEEKNIEIGEFYEYIREYCKFRRDNFQNPDRIYELINKHKQKCTLTNCLCNSLFKTLICFDDNIDEFNKELIIIGEQEITNKIYSFYKTKKFNKIFEHYCFLHVQYIYIISQRNYLALYFANKYLHSPYITGKINNYFLYESKKQILEEIFNEKIKIENHFYGFNNHINIKKYLSTIKQLKKFFYFTLLIEKIKNLLLDNLRNLEIVFLFRREMRKNVKLTSLNKKTFNNFLKSCNIIKNNDEYIQNLLSNHLKGKIIHNLEIGFLLTNYFYLIHHQIPSKIEGTFEQRYQYSFISELIEYDENEFNMKYPMIVSLSNISDIFLISYINNILCESLGFTKSKIINNDFQILIPKDITKVHSCYMKQFLFIPGAFFSKNTYILDNEKYLVNCFFECKILPDFQKVFRIIINFKLTLNDNDNTLIYSVFLDKHLSFVSLCRDFEHLFFFNMRMFEILNINFCEFFGLNQTSLYNHLRKDENEEKNASFIEEDKALSIFTIVSPEKIFKYRKEKKSIQNLRKKVKVYKQFIEKKQILEGLSNLVKTIDEIGLDIEWYQRVKCLGQRLKVRPPTHSLINLNPSFNENAKSFEAIFYSKFIDDIPYYIVKIEEKNLIHLAKNVSDINKQFFPIKRRYSYFNPIINNSYFDKEYITENNKNFLNFKTTLNIKSKSPKKSTIMNIVKKEVKFLEKLTPNNLTELNNSNSFQNSNLDLLNNSFSLKITSNNNKNKENNSLNLDNNSLNSKKSDIGNITIIKGFNYFGDKYLFKDILIKKLFHKKGKKITKNIIINKIIIFGYIIIIFLTICLEILKKHNFKEYYDIFKCNILLEIIKTDLYISSLLSFKHCFELSIAENETSEFKNLILWKLNNLRIHSNKFNSFVNSLHKKHGINNIFNLLYKENKFYSLNIDWEKNERNSTFFEEINLFIYLLSQNYYDKKIICNINNFFEEKNLTSNEQFESPSNLDKLTFYSINNLMQNFKHIFEDLSFLCYNIILKLYNEFSFYILFFSISIFLISLFNFILHWNKLLNDKKKIKHILSYLFKTSLGEHYFEKQVINFKLILEDFNGQNIYIFEESKEEEIKFLSEKNKIEQENNLKKNSRNDVSRKTYNNISNKPFNNDNNWNNDENEKNNENFQQKILMPNAFIYSFILITFCFTIVILFLIINIVYSINIKHQFIFSFSMSINFLERIPKAADLLYYLEISTLINNISFITNDLYPLKENYLNYYNIKISPDENSQLKSFENSFYYILYIQGIIVELNIKQFLGNDKGILDKLRILEFSLNAKNSLCESISLNSINFIDIEIKDEFFSAPEIRKNICLNYCKSLNENGLYIEMDYIYQELINLFYDFAKNNSIQNGTKLINNSDIKRINNDFIHAFSYVFSSYCKIIIQNVGKNNKKIQKFGTLISYFFIIFILLIISLISFFIFRVIEKYEDVLLFFYKMY